MFVTTAELDLVGPRHVGVMLSMPYVLRSAQESLRSVMASDSITGARSISEALANPDTLCLFCMDTPEDGQKPKLLSGMAVLCKGTTGGLVGSSRDHRYVKTIVFT